MRHSTLFILISALSIVAISAAVKAESEVPKVADAHDTDLKDSVKNGQSDLTKLVGALMSSGGDVNYPNGFAQAVGLDQPMDAKGAVAVLNGEGHRCHVIYTKDADTKRPVCLYFVRAKKSKTDVEERFFRVNLDGTLEKVVTLRNKLDENGKAIREGRSKTDENIDSPDIKKAFKNDMKFWVKDWLKKEQKLIAKKTKTDGVRASAAAADQSLDKAAPAAAPSAQ